MIGRYSAAMFELDTTVHTYADGAHDGPGTLGDAVVVSGVRTGRSRRRNCRVHRVGRVPDPFE